MEDSATGLFGTTPIIIWLALSVVGCGFLGIALLVCIKYALRRRGIQQNERARSRTQVVDAWSESAKRMNGQK